MKKSLRLVLFLVASALHIQHTLASPALDGVKRIVFYGDSLTDGSSYPDYVVNTLNRTHPDRSFELYNAAVCGDTAAHLLGRLGDDVLPLRPDLVVIGIGTNDAISNVQPEKFRENVRFLIDSLQQHRSKVMLILPSPIRDEVRGQRLLQLIEVLQDLAKEYHLPVADAHGLFKQWEAEGKDVLGSDGIHHGSDGFACMAEAVLGGLGFRGVPLDKEIRPKEGLLLDWETSAPISKRKDDGYDPAEAHSWKRFLREPLLESLGWADAPFVARGAWTPFDGLPSKDQVAFGRTFFEAPQAGRYRIEVGGSTRPLIVWINGSRVWSSSRLHGYHPNADRFEVELKAGRNEIMVVSNYMTFVGIYQ